MRAFLQVRGPEARAPSLPRLSPVWVCTWSSGPSFPLENVIKNYRKVRMVLLLPVEEKL